MIVGGAINHDSGTTNHDSEVMNHDGGTMAFDVKAWVLMVGPGFAVFMMGPCFCILGLAHGVL